MRVLISGSSTSAYVGHPELLMIEEDDDTLVVSEPGVSRRVNDMDAITEIEVKKARPRRNGEGKRGR